MLIRPEDFERELKQLISKYDYDCFIVLDKSYILNISHDSKNVQRTYMQYLNNKSLYEDDDDE